MLAYAPMEMKDWQDRWQKQQTGWDLQTVHPDLPVLWQQVIENQWLKLGSQVFVPGCGTGHEAAFVANAGWQTTAVDYVPEAIHKAKKTYPMIGRVDWQVADVLQVAYEDRGRFGAVVDRAMLCAIDEGQRRPYLEACAQRLAPGGVFVGILFAEVQLQAGKNGPPHALNVFEVTKLMAGLFTLVSGWEACAMGLPEWVKKEFCCIWRKV